MLGNIIGKRNAAHRWSNPSMHNPEYRLKSLRGQDRSVNVFSHARETAKGFPINFLMEGDTVRTCTIK